MTTYRQPEIEVVSLEPLGDGTTAITIRFLEASRVSEPLAPAYLLRDVQEPWDERKVLELHRVLRADDDLVTFVSPGGTASAPGPGTRLLIQQWWVPEAFEIAVDRDRAWVEMPYDDTGHDYCLLGYESHDEGVPAMRDGNGTWICCECHEKYVLNDYLGLQKAQQTKES